MPKVQGGQFWLQYNNEFLPYAKVAFTSYRVASKNELIEMSDLNITACMQSVGIDLYQEMLSPVNIAECNCGKDSCPTFESRVFSSRTWKSNLLKTLTFTKTKQFSSSGVHLLSESCIWYLSSALGGLQSLPSSVDNHSSKSSSMSLRVNPITNPLRNISIVSRDWSGGCFTGRILDSSAEVHKFANVSSLTAHKDHVMPVSSHLKNLNHILVSVRDSLWISNLYESGIIFTVSIMDPHDIALHTQTTATNIINTHTPGFTYLHVVWG